MRSVGGLCERCLEKGLIVPAVIVHHKTYITPNNITDPNIVLNFDNLEALCKNCHNYEHIDYANGMHKQKHFKKREHRYKIFENGKVKLTDPPPP